MENNLTIIKKCYCCKTDYTEFDKFCGTCGYPLQGSDIEKKKFSSKYVANQFEKEVVRARVKEARIILYVIAIFTIVQGLIIYSKDENAVLLVINFILSGIYTGLGFWAAKKAFASIFIGGLMYISIILLTAIVEPSTFFNGMIIKGIIIAAFIKASYGAYKYKV